MQQDQIVWEAFRAGEHQAFLALYDQYFPVLFRYCRQLTPDTAMVEDVIHDLFLELWDRRHRLGPVRSAQAYLLASVRRKMIRQTQQSTPERLPETLPEPFELIESATLKDSLAGALQTLNEQQREILYLKFYQNLSYQEVAETLELKAATVYKTAQRALRKLKKHPLLTGLISSLILAALLFF